MTKRNNKPFTQKLGDVFEQLGNFFKRLFGEVKEFIEDYVEPAFRIVNNLKELVNNPEIVTFAETLFKGISPEAIKWFQRVLPQVLDYLGIVVECADEDSPDEFVRCLVEKLRELAEGNRKGMYLKIVSTSARLAFNENKSEDNTIDEPLADYFAQAQVIKEDYKDYIKS